MQVAEIRKHVAARAPMVLGRSVRLPEHAPPPQLAPYADAEGQ
jgi:hypothetical protein